MSASFIVRHNLIMRVHRKSLTIIAWVVEVEIIQVIQYNYYCFFKFMVKKKKIFIVVCLLFTLILYYIYLIRPLLLQHVYSIVISQI